LCDVVTLRGCKEVKQRTGIFWKKTTLFGKQILGTNFKHNLFYSVTFDEKYSLLEEGSV
jgi:hypothetical protein